MAVATVAPSTTPPAPITPETRLCRNCEGAGVVETCTYGVGLHEVHCPGEDESGNCDDGLVW